MVLYINISANDQSIVTYGAQNITGNKTGQNTYRVCKYVKKSDGIARRVYLSGELCHNHEDGATMLAWKVLGFVQMVGGKEMIYNRREHEKWRSDTKRATVLVLADFERRKRAFLDNTMKFYGDE